MELQKFLNQYHVLKKFSLFLDSDNLKELNKILLLQKRKVILLIDKNSYKLILKYYK